MKRVGMVAVALAGAPLAGAGEEHLGPVTGILVAGDKIYSSSQAGLLVGVGGEARHLHAPGFRVHGLALQRSDSGMRILMAGGEPGESGRLAALEVTNDSEDQPLDDNLADDLLYDVAVSPDGASIAWAEAEGTVRFATGRHLAAGGRTVRHTHTAAARCVAFSPDGQWLASAGLDGVVMVSPTAAKPPVVPLQLLDHTAGVESMAWSPDSKMLATGSKDSKVRLHEVSGKLVRTYHGLGMEAEPVAGRVPARILALAWNESVLVAGTSKGSLYRLSPIDDTARRIARPGDAPVYSLAFAPGGGLLVGSESRMEVLSDLLEAR